ncbi:lecithin retinol acyltransferase family protein [Dolichospermum circinale]|uniref:lecithin retinol acyltransferase family protein n=1 Tax=Dolichospermum circinale TaxID=109265 RepID=UPI00232EDFD5|nr:lecithin retinol acyltransferase family protein [Dolichospermum circinale]MDB9466289.1 hypothetical protein [Dolichospermum circinale CS-539/09]MDB9469904.1 hypothetical protein [Dolichospermum circinale CS-539]
MKDRIVKQEDCKCGDLLYVYVNNSGNTVKHYGIVSEDMRIYHFYAQVKKDNNTIFRKTSFEEFSKSRNIYKSTHFKTESFPDIILFRAALLAFCSKENIISYDLYSVNCQHTTQWCKTGVWRSPQINVSNLVRDILLLFIFITLFIFIDLNYIHSDYFNVTYQKGKNLEFLINLILSFFGQLLKIQIPIFFYVFISQFIIPLLFKKGIKCPRCGCENFNFYKFNVSDFLITKVFWDEYKSGVILKCKNNKCKNKFFYRESLEFYNPMFPTETKPRFYIFISLVELTFERLQVPDYVRMIVGVNTNYIQEYAKYQGSDESSIVKEYKDKEKSGKEIEYRASDRINFDNRFIINEHCLEAIRNARISLEEDLEKE